MDFILQPWPWYISGPLIAFVLFLFFFLGKNFGVSTNLETICTLAGAGKFYDYFKKDWKERDWALIFLIGLAIGGFIAANYLTLTTNVNLSSATAKDLTALGFVNAGKTYVPSEIFSIENMLSLKGFFVLLVAGVLIGFGTRYASGCTSGHAITGLSSLQLPSLIAVIGFFIGGIIMTWILFPLIFS